MRNQLSGRQRPVWWVLLLALFGVIPMVTVAASQDEPNAGPNSYFAPVVFMPAPAPPPPPNALSWQHLSTTNNALPVPSTSDQQALSLLLDVNKDGVNDFVIGARGGSGASLVWYRRDAGGWTRFVIESDSLPLEAGGAFYDIDGDGDLDVAAGGNNQSNEIWWWENPYPNYAPTADWARRLIKNSGQTKHHDMMFGNFDDDPGTEFAFWNQNADKLFLVNVPGDARATQPWPGAVAIFTAPNHKYEGLTQVDVDLDGKTDLISGGYWFKHNGGNSFAANPLGQGEFMRVAAGQIIPGGRPEIIQVPGDADGPGRLFAWNGSSWAGSDLPVGQIRSGHSLDLADVNGDGLLDIFIGEMKYDSGHANHNPNARTMLLLGNGLGGFAPALINGSFGHHESRLGDLDGDGDIDILGKPFSWDTPRLDVWLNQSNAPDTCAVTTPVAEWGWQRHLIDGNRPGRAAFMFPLDVNGDGRLDFITGKFWYANPGAPGGQWSRTPLPAPIEDTLATHDIDGDGNLDLLATTGPTVPNNEGYWWPVVWARNDGGGAFTVFQNLDTAGVTMPPNDPIQGVAIARLNPGGPLEVALSWDDTEDPARNPYGIQVFTVPANAASQTWTRRQLSGSLGEQLSAADLDGDSDLDLFLGYRWLRNNHPAGTWSPIDIFTVEDKQQASRHSLVDMDGDGDLDAIIGFAHSPADRRVSWYERPSDPTAAWPHHLVGYLEKGFAESMDVIDIDFDGDFDIVVGEYNVHYPANGPAEERPASLWIFENKGGGANWERHLAHFGDSHYQSSQAVDIDGDGDLDILAKGWLHNQVYLYENKSSACPPAP